MSVLPPISELNTASRDGFLVAVNTLFEVAPPLGDHLYAGRPYSSYGELIDRAQALIQSDKLTREEKIEVINAHPRIGEHPANLSALSLKEQGYQERTVSPQEQQVNRTLAKLNENYEARYGFKFVVFVNGRPRTEIIKVIGQRLATDNVDEELTTGLTDMMAIARDRLNKLGRQ
ncbi:Oxo-4-hydroxy-4-carboxy-5-ureidoimidazoline decarboxylase [Jimgerdemannia flammicorona]|uniref:Oxo-4-hydroxy-4-carboxy-5-ureidoimidazoline decarboxylase n=2 Tax=Jimgerdemannia flammicorona TaxID=994334 RepID=A0A433DGW3_9FUNG|nr:Oxo-4-hydroxy-4-carboxy-5-ureidoimidazoline decarboxylase [Jimgerdemannia flammicorona]RUS30272.1 Oxo-4-hydroxy-4-carboxy-5-ureidoimidazoline decarboxylase [Jimgerdemannia flammicorona]